MKNIIEVQLALLEHGYEPGLIFSEFIHESIEDALILAEYQGIKAAIKKGAKSLSGKTAGQAQKTVKSIPKMNPDQLKHAKALQVFNKAKVALSKKVGRALNVSELKTLRSRVFSKMNVPSASTVRYT